MHSFHNFIVRLIPNHPPPLETRIWKLVVRALVTCVRAAWVRKKYWREPYLSKKYKWLVGKNWIKIGQKSSYLICNISKKCLCVWVGGEGRSYYRLHVNHIYTLNVYWHNVHAHSKKICKFVVNSCKPEFT